MKRIGLLAAILVALSLGACSAQRTASPSAPCNPPGMPCQAAAAAPGNAAPCHSAGAPCPMEDATAQGAAASCPMNGGSGTPCRSGNMGIPQAATPSGR